MPDLLEGETGHETRVCTGCHLELPITKFTINRVRTWTGRRSRCNRCRQQTPGYRRYADSYPALAAARKKSFRRQMEEQGVDRCQACGADSELHVDHCHETGEARGFLCRHCNVGLGFFKHDRRRLELALDYLDRVRREP